MKPKYLTFLSGLLLTLLTLSCGEDTVDSGFEQNSKLVGSKWTLTTWDYSLGDDYVGLHDETYNFFFYSQTEGAFYYGRKDNYSDQGSSNQRIVCHFTYVVNGDEILLEYITDKYLRTTKLRLNGNILLADQLEFAKESISYTDTQWLNTVHGTTGSCSWYSDMNGTLWILGEGAMADYVSYSATPWGKSNRTPDRVVIGEGVTAIGSYAFANPSVAEVDWPDISLKQIGEAAFKGSTIKELWMSNSVTSIGKDAFADCEYLKQVSIPDDIVSIGECAFSGCAIREFILEFGSNLRTIGTFAFEGGHASYLIFKEGVQSISTGAFIGDFCSISEELLLPNSLKSIGATVFEGPYKKIVIGTGVTEIGEKAFISGATSGEMYINLSTPPSVGDNIIVERQGWNSAESRWTLYVPKGCKSAYSNKSPWNKFKSIIEDSSLEGGNANNGSGNETENEDGNGDENDGENNSTGYINGYEYVDLGLSVKWASCNIGATKPEEYGSYFAWGETKPTSKTRAEWRYYELCDGSRESCKDIGANISGTKYDAATSIMGKGWRMPTLEEWKELKSKCDFEWSTVNGIEGLKVTGPNENSIFLPAGGDITTLGTGDENRGNYWTPNHDYGGEIYQAECVRFYEYNNSVTFSVPHWQKSFRCYCQSIRAVTE